MTPPDHLFQQFQTQGTLKELRPFGSGLINDTFLALNADPKQPHYIFQRMNHAIFNNIPALMNNIVLVTQHIQTKLRAEPAANVSRECLTVILAQDGKPYIEDEQQNFWTCYLYIDGTKSYDLVDNPQLAFEGGKMFGRFLHHLSDFPSERLHETIPDFHHIGQRLAQFETALLHDSANRAKQIREEIAFINTHADAMKSILRLGESGEIPLRITHNDTKFNNVLLDDQNKGVCVVDLHTVMPGYIHYDFSDGIRTVANAAMEDEKDLSKVYLNLELFEAFSKGFLQDLKHSLTAIELEHLAESSALLPYMVGLRFLTDYLNGDRYFKIQFPEHNLQRARAQFQLVKSIQANLPQLKSIINQIAAS